MVTLEKLSISDKERLAFLANDPRISATSSIEYPCTPEMVQEWIDINNEAAPQRLTFVIRVEGEVAGACSLKQINWETKTAELSYWVARIHWGKGLGRSAARLLRDYAFEVLKLEMLRAYCLKESNRPSRQILQDVGFQLDLSHVDIQVEGRFAALFPDDAWIHYTLPHSVWLGIQENIIADVSHDITAAKFPDR